MSLYEWKIFPSWTKFTVYFPGVMAIEANSPLLSVLRSDFCPVSELTNCTVRPAMGAPSVPVTLPCTRASIWDQPATAEIKSTVLIANIVVSFLFISVSCCGFFLLLNFLRVRLRLISNRIAGPGLLKGTQAEHATAAHSTRAVMAAVTSTESLERV